MCYFYFFFFSSRRRHTRCYRDWSSDVCSSDLLGEQDRVVPRQHDDGGAQPQRRRARAHPRQQIQRGRDLTESREVVLDEERTDEAERLGFDVQIDEISEPGAAVGVRTATLGLGT